VRRLLIQNSSRMSSGVDPNLPEPEAGTAGLKIA
jgi:hypothetical protein